MEGYEYKLLRYKHVVYKSHENSDEYDLVPDGKQINLTEEEFQSIYNAILFASDHIEPEDDENVFTLPDKLKKLL